MKYAVIYQSKSGNTKFLAETICDELEGTERILVDIDKMKEIPVADFYFIGFGIHDYACRLEIADMMERMAGVRYALFMTCGLVPTEKYRANLLKTLEIWLPENSKQYGAFLCQGRVSSDQCNNMIRKFPHCESELRKMFQMGEEHPNVGDMYACKDFVRMIRRKIE